MKLHKNDTQSLVDLDNVILWIPQHYSPTFGHLIRFACHVIHTATATAHCTLFFKVI